MYLLLLNLYLLQLLQLLLLLLDLLLKIDQLLLRESIRIDGHVVTAEETLQSIRIINHVQQTLPIVIHIRQDNPKREHNQ